MTRAFETEPGLQREHEWADEPVRREVEPSDLVPGNRYGRGDGWAMTVVRQLRVQAKDGRLWACRLFGARGFRSVGAGTEAITTHAYMRNDNVCVPTDHIPARRAAAQARPAHHLELRAAAH